MLLTKLAQECSDAAMFANTAVVEPPFNKVPRKNHAEGLNSRWKLPEGGVSDLRSYRSYSHVVPGATDPKTDPDPVDASRGDASV